MTTIHPLDPDPLFDPADADETRFVDPGRTCATVLRKHRGSCGYAADRAPPRDVGSHVYAAGVHRPKSSNTRNGVRRGAVGRVEGSPRREPMPSQACTLRHSAVRIT